MRKSLKKIRKNREKSGKINMDLSVTPLETHPCKNQIPYSTIGNSEEAHLMI